MSVGKADNLSRVIRGSGVVVDDETFVEERVSVVEETIDEELSGRVGPHERVPHDQIVSRCAHRIAQYWHVRYRPFLEKLNHFSK